VTADADNAASGVDDEPISDDDWIYRRLSDNGPTMIAIDALTGRRRPTSGSFKPDDDGVSVYLESRLNAASLGAVDLVKVPQNVVVSLGVVDVRTVTPLDVHDDPWPQDVVDPRHPRNAAHALIIGWAGLGRSDRRARQRALADAPSLSFVYP
jgi:hypothetical protein